MLPSVEPFSSDIDIFSGHYASFVGALIASGSCCLGFALVRQKKAEMVFEVGNSQKAEIGNGGGFLPPPKTGSLNK